ncbi:MAG TPA: hypothetical protein VMV69_08645 [Pirellulales bacterium]|nr:hypothetical protein [Pirellulales bacterium]
MRWITLSICVLLAGASLTWAFDEPKKKPAKESPPAKEPSEEDTDQSEKSVAEQVKAVQTEMAQKQREIVKKFQAAADDAERNKLREEYYGLQSAFAAKYAVIVEKHPDDKAVFPALQGMMSSPEHVAEAVDVLLKHHLDNAQLGLLCLQLGMQDTEGGETLLRAVAEKSKSSDAKGMALLALGQMLFLRSNQEGLDDTQRDKLREEAEEALQTVVDKYADVQAGRGKAGDTASGVLFEVQHLAVGKEVPDLQGEDLEGTEFKLSDYRGKVVFLDFWAHW